MFFLFLKYFTTVQVCCTFWMRSLEMVGQMELYEPLDTTAILASSKRLLGSAGHRDPCHEISGKFDFEFRMVEF